MIAELPAEEELAVPVLDDGAWLEQILPVLRVRTYSPFPLFPRAHEVVALYRDEVVVLRKKKAVPIPEEAYRSDGAAALHATPGRSFSVPCDQVRKVISTPRSVVSEHDSLHISGSGRSVRASVLQEETPNLYRALGLLLGPRFHARRWRPPFGSYGLLAVFAVVLGAAVAAGKSAVGTLLNVAAPALWVTALILLILGVILWIPGRRKGPRQVKKKPLKDLSGRQPLRLRVAGLAVSVFGALWVLYFFGDVLFFTVQPMLPGGFEAGEAWYLKIGQLTLLIFALIAGGSFVMSSAGPLTVAILGLMFLGNLGIRGYELLRTQSAEGFYQFLWLLSPYLGLSLIYTGRRLVSRNARTAIAGDVRAPILYLRSFEDDVEDTLTPHTGLANYFSQTLSTGVRRLPLPLRVIYEFQPLRLLRSLFGRVTPTTELQLAAFFRKFGPFVAIGKPGERLATFGADRDFVDNDKWRAVVLDYLQQAYFVVLQAAGTQGFLWELRTVLTRVEPRKILFSLSNFRGRQNDYEDFRLKVESVGGWRFPRSVGNHDEPQFLFFDADRTPVLHAVSYRSPVLWPVLAGVTDLEHTLAEFVHREGPAPAPYAPKKYPGRGVLALILTLAIAPAVGGLVMYVAVLAAPLVLPATRAQAEPFPEMKFRPTGLEKSPPGP